MRFGDREKQHLVDRARRIDYKLPLIDEVDLGSVARRSRIPYEGELISRL
jgi:hypothetical protein